VKRFDTLSLIMLFLLAAFDATLWYQIISFRHSPDAHAYFLDVGQGDAELIVFPGNIKVMTDAGPDAKVMNSLANIIPESDRYIDVAIISHPQLDHFNGYSYLLDHYAVGAFIYNGRDDAPNVQEWPALLSKIKAKHIPLITLGKGDRVRYENNIVEMLSPDQVFDQSAELNDTGFVEFVRSKDLSVLLPADTGFNVETYLLSERAAIHADVLKVGHHGSKYSSGGHFLNAVQPAIAVIEVGAKNHYGHPSRDALARLASSTKAIVLRTDQGGTIDIWKQNGVLKYKREKEATR